MSREFFSEGSQSGISNDPVIGLDAFSEGSQLHDSFLPTHGGLDDYAYEAWYVYPTRTETAQVGITEDVTAAWELSEAQGVALDWYAENTLRIWGPTDGIVTAAGLVHDTARDFNSANDDVFKVGNLADTVLGDIDFTFEAWVNLESKVVNKRSVFCKVNDNTNLVECELAFNNISDRFTFRVSDDGSTFSTATANTLGSPSVATWYHLVCWHDSVNDVIGISINDGTANTTAHSVGTIGDASDDSTTAIGGNPTIFGGSADRWNGLIGPVRFWKRVLTSGERTWLYNGGSGRSVFSDDALASHYATAIWEYPDRTAEEITPPPTGSIPVFRHHYVMQGAA